jgi:hypothetical protein
VFELEVRCSFVLYYKQRQLLEKQEKGLLNAFSDMVMISGVHFKSFSNVELHKEYNYTRNLILPIPCRGIV